MIVTHEPTATAYADRVLFLADGLIVRTATSPDCSRPRRRIAVGTASLCGSGGPPRRSQRARVEIEIRRARRVEIMLQLATFPEAPLRSRTVGFPESGSGLGSARHFSGRAFPHRAKLRCWRTLRPDAVEFASPLRHDAGPAESSSVSGCLPTVVATECPEPLCPERALPAPGRPRKPPGGALPPRLRSYGLMRQTIPLPAPRLSPCARGLRRLSPVPAARWPFPTLSLRPLRRCSDPYPAALLGCACPLLHRGHRSHPTLDGFDARIYPHTATSVGSPISRLQSFDHLRAPTLARPPGCSHRSSANAAGRPGLSHHASPGRLLLGFSRSSQHLDERSCDGKAAKVRSGRSSREALAGSFVGRASGGAPAVLGGDRPWCVECRRGWRGGGVGSGWRPVVSRGWRDAHCHSGPVVGALPVTC